MGNSMLARHRIRHCLAAAMLFAAWHVVSAGQIDTALWHWEGLHAVLAGSGVSVSESGPSVANVRAYVIAPLVSQGPLFLGAGLDYEYLHLDRLASFGSDSSLGVGTEQLRGLHRCAIPLAFYYEFNKQWYMYLEGDPTIQSSMRPLKRDHGGFFCYAYAAYMGTKLARFRFGLAYDYDLGGHSVYPLLGISWTNLKHFAFDSLLPSHVLLRWKVAQRLETGIKGKISSRSISTDAMNPAGDAILRYTQLTTGPYFDIRLVKKLDLRFETGPIIYRSVRVDRKDEIVLEKSTVGFDVWFVDVHAKWAF